MDTGAENLPASNNLNNCLQLIAECRCLTLALESTECSSEINHYTQWAQTHLCKTLYCILYNQIVVTSSFS